MNQVNLNETDILSFRGMDRVGIVFSLNNKIHRAIRPEAQNEVVELLNSGLIDELVSKNYFPKTVISNYQIDGFSMVLEHETFPNLTYPYEWSFSMFKDAALLIVELNEISRKYGYQTKDCHAYNIVFDKEQPKFIDFGSIVKTPNNNWVAYEEFIQYYYYPLKLWSRGDNYLPFRINSFPAQFCSHATYVMSAGSWKNIFGFKRLSKWYNGYYKLRKMSFFNDEQILKKVPMGLGKTVLNLKNKNRLPLQSVNLKRLKKQILNIKIQHPKTMWDDYHHQYINKDGGIKPSQRFSRILEIVDTLNISSAIELGGNQGAFSQLLLEKTKVKNVICTDYDDTAIDQLYLQLKKTPHNINPVVLNPVFPIITHRRPNADQRLQQEVVIALALTHHLILTQAYPLEIILNDFKKYTNRYMIIEFMPLGIWSKKSLDAKVPDWYTQDWFRGVFSEHFNILFEEQLEKNRVVFVGELKK